MTDQEAIELLKRFETGECTAEEKLLLYNYYDELDRSSPNLDAWLPNEEIRQQVWQELKSEWLDRQRAAKLRRLYWPVAAAVVLVLALGAWYLTLQPKAVRDVYALNKEHDIPAGGNRAVLTLANGQQITLDSAAAGTIAIQAGVTISQSATGQLVYTITDAGTAANTGAGFNTISTPNGGQYKVVLPDGTQVWLNAASRLKYPVKFIADERKVVLNGEAYFEVTKNPDRPFIVNAGNQVVKVLGTRFNINSYTDEQEIKTTLAEGKVKVSLLDPNNNLPLNHQFTLRPGQQAVSTAASLKLKEVSADEAIAWKDGLFVFSQSSIKQVMQQISRWYDVDVDYKDLPEKRFEGEISRDIPLSELLRAIEKTNQITFLIEGRKLTVVK